jgi:hypothetical protein
MDESKHRQEQEALRREVARAINHANGSNYPLLTGAPFTAEVVTNEGYFIDLDLDNGHKYRLILERRK